MSQLEAGGHGQAGFQSCEGDSRSHDAVKHRITVPLRGPRGLGQHCPHELGPVRRWLVQWHKKHGVETTGPALKAENRGCLHLFLLAQKFSFSRDVHSLESRGGKTTRLLLEGAWESQQGPVSSGGFWHGGGGCRAPQLHLGVENEQEQDEVTERRHRAAQAPSVPGTEKTYKARQLPAARARGLSTQMRKRLFTEASPPASTWVTSIFQADKCKWIQKCEKIEKTHIKRKGVGTAFRF